jgi:hypothetical protein
MVLGGYLIRGLLVFAPGFCLKKTRSKMVSWYDGRYGLYLGHCLYLVVLISATTRCSFFQTFYLLFKNFTAILVISELIEARARRRKQHHVGWNRVFRRCTDRLLQSL